MAINTLSEEELNLRMELYHSGYTDAEAATALGLSRTSYTTWRSRMGLKSKFARGQQKHRSVAGSLWRDFATIKPSDDGYKLMMDKSGTVYIGKYSDGKVTIMYDNRDITDTITNWRNIPKKYV